MKKRIAALLTVIVLLSAVSPAEEVMTADLTEGSRLIGLLITGEDLSAYTGGSGVLFASRTQTGPDGETEYSFGEIKGLRLICFMTRSENGEGSGIISNVDDGISAVDFEMNEDGSSIKMEATIRFVPGRDDALFFCNPVMLAASGQVFAVPGDCMAVSAAMDPPGSCVGQTVRDVRKHTENGTEISDTTMVDIRIQAVRAPLKIRLLQFSRTHELLKSEEFMPGAVPEQIFPLDEADYLLLETEEEDLYEGSFTRREVFGRDADYLNTLSCRDDGICLFHYHEILWTSDSAPGHPV